MELQTDSAILLKCDFGKAPQLPLRSLRERGFGEIFRLLGGDHARQENALMVCLVQRSKRPDWTSE